MPFRSLVLALSSLALVTTLAACGAGDGSVAVASAPAGTASVSSAGEASREGDVTFAQMMIPHHAQAVQMADLALKGASSPEVTSLATQIKAAQSPEIEAMRGWLTRWGAEETMPGMEGMEGMDHDMPGIMSDADMAALSAAGGADFDRLWLQMMIAHHEGALTMADDVLATTADAQVRTLARAIVAGQTAEIATMKALLAG